MFKSPFSFNGRIRRKEYGISTLIYFIIVYITHIFKNAISSNFVEENFSIFYLLIIFPAIYFYLAQGAKRCLDIGNSGWWQLIPFYFIQLLVVDSHSGENEYGLNPKGIGNDTTYDSLIESIGK